MQESKIYGYEMADPVLYGILKEYATEHRQKPTEAESVMWEYLKGKQTGFSFRRQHIIGPFIADFVCLQRHVIVEIDGGYHQHPSQQISDEERTAWLTSKGFSIIRFTNEQVLFDTDIVIDHIIKFLIKELP